MAPRAPCPRRVDSFKSVQTCLTPSEESAASSSVSTARKIVQIRVFFCAAGEGPSQNIAPLILSSVSDANMEIGEFGMGRPDFGGRRPRGEALGQKKSLTGLQSCYRSGTSIGVLPCNRSSRMTPESLGRAPPINSLVHLTPTKNTVKYDEN